MDAFLSILSWPLSTALLGFRGTLYHCHFYYSLPIFMSFPLDEEGFH
jgi:hypothetical protein